ncbi:hypothetical protein [Chondromyces crocatus]|uniref:Uncharacterized protein n=1 Tax=Chondromyces crocatus TaxID=52 RepID=A0A0K1EQR6_CHOCO|nr:hypothetical protein [Chondromyces crocatus]AKT42997.1 uncharacterized protein CMC5_072240 [Chondromyces crocatus]
MVLFALFLGVLTQILRTRYSLGPGAFLPCVGFATIAFVAARNTKEARSAVWRAVCLGLSDPRQRPTRLSDPWFMPPSALVLFKLAEMLDAVRRGEMARAAGKVTNMNRALLRPDEERLLDAARAMIALDLGERRLAAQLAARVLPTGSGDLDVRLGRVVVAEAWRSPAQLEEVDHAFREHGLGLDLGTPLNRLAALVRVRVAPDERRTLPADDARALGDEARALGEDEFAAELEARSRTAMYR